MHSIRRITIILFKPLINVKCFIHYVFLKFDHDKVLIRLFILSAYTWFLFFKKGSLYINNLLWCECINIFLTLRGKFGFYNYS